MASPKVAEKRIGMPEIKMKAQTLGLTPGNMKKPELIHAIQVAEGNTPCFGKSNGRCPYTDCCFMQDCLKSPY
ncbi:MAG: SAP domain-containing protein [Planctomycetota bacterium]